MSYPSDVTDAEWADIQFLLQQPKKRTQGRQRIVDMRSIVNAVYYRRRAKCPWRYLPNEFPHWRTVYDYHTKWIQNGLLRHLDDIRRRHK